MLQEKADQQTTLPTEENVFNNEATGSQIPGEESGREAPFANQMTA